MLIVALEFRIKPIWSEFYAPAWGAHREGRTEGSSHQARRYFAQEIGWGGFSRSFRLPSYIDPDKVSASFKEGVLVLDVPKRNRDESKLPNRSVIFTIDVMRARWFMIHPARCAVMTWSCTQARLIASCPYSALRDEQSEPRCLGRGLRRSGHRVGHLGSPAPSLQHHQHQRGELPAP
jgi:hypothetical protein